jgi:hypothetical protein
MLLLLLPLLPQRDGRDHLQYVGLTKEWCRRSVVSSKLSLSSGLVPDRSTEMNLKSRERVSVTLDSYKASQSRIVRLNVHIRLITFSAIFRKRLALHTLCEELCCGSCHQKCRLFGGWRNDVTSQLPGPRQTARLRVSIRSSLADRPPIFHQPHHPLTNTTNTSIPPQNQ